MKGAALTPTLHSHQGYNRSMEFMCSRCGRTDEVVGDDSPLCLYCRAPLIKATHTYEGLWMSPEFVLSRMRKVVEKHGFERAGTGRFKREREASTSGLYALALSEMYGKKYWIEIETVEQTPDTMVHHLNQSAGHNNIETQNIEVVDWEQHVDDPMSLVSVKCQKSYPSNFCLLIAARRETMLYPQMVASDIRKMCVPFAEIWIVGVSTDTTAHVVRLHPTTLPLQFDIREALKRARVDADLLRRGQRGSSTEFVSLGATYLPIP